MDIIVQVDLKDLDLGEQIGAYYDEDGDRIGGHTLAEAVVAKLVAHAAKDGYHDDLKRRVEAIRDEEIRKLIAPAIEDAIAKPVKKTNSWGEPTGEETTMRDVIVAEARKFFKEPVDQYHSERGTRLQAMIRAHVEAAFKAEIAAAVKAAREAVTAQLGASISDVVTDAVRNGLRAAR